MPKLTDKMVQGLKPKDSRYEARDGDGLAVRVSPSGSKTWILIFDQDGKRSKMNLGDYPAMSLKDARIAASEQKKQLRAGINPVTVRHQEKAKKAAEATVEEFVKTFLEKGVEAKGLRSAAEYRRNLNYDVLPAWGKRKVADIERADVIELLEKIHDRGAPNQSRQVFKIIRRMFNFAIERGVIQNTPCYLVKPIAPEVKKDRNLSDDEIRYIWQQFNKCVMSPAIIRVLKLILLTAARPGEVIGAHKSEIDGDWWVIPASRSKNKREHRVYLTKTAKDLFIKHEHTEWMFPSPRSGKLDKDGNPIDMPMKATAPSHALLLNFKPKGTKPAILQMPEWTPHDLRRTAATNLAKLGYTDEIIGEVLNHTRTGVTSIYNRHRYDMEKQKALEALERHVLAITTGISAGNVVPLVKKAK